jgi:hypothetical protein
MIIIQHGGGTWGERKTDDENNKRGEPGDECQRSRFVVIGFDVESFESITIELNQMIR